MREPHLYPVRCGGGGILRVALFDFQVQIQVFTGTCHSALYVCMESVWLSVRHIDFHNKLFLYDFGIFSSFFYSFFFQT